MAMRAGGEERDDAAFVVPLDRTFSMRLRRGELELVASGLGEFDSSEEGNLVTLAEALRRLPVGDRAPTWELAVRRYGHHKSLEQAAGEVGLDAIRARELLERYTHLLLEVPPPESGVAEPHDPATELEESSTARFVSAEALSNAIAHGESVNLDAAHERSLRAAEETRVRAHPHPPAHEG